MVKQIQQTRKTSNRKHLPYRRQIEQNKEIHRIEWHQDVTPTIEWNQRLNEIAALWVCKSVLRITFLMQTDAPALTNG